MYHLFNKEKYLGNYVINIDLQVFLESYAVNHFIDLKNLHIYESEYFDGGGKVVKFTTKEISLYEIVEEEVDVLKNIYDESTPGLTEDEKKLILENKIFVQQGGKFPDTWPQRQFKEIQNKEIIIKTYPLKLIL